MANALYGLGLNKFARGEIAWQVAAGDTIRGMLVDSATYTPNMVTDEFFDDVPEASRFGNSGGHNRGDGAALTLIDPALGVCDGADVTITAVPANGILEYILLYKDTGVDGTSPLLLLIDTATGLPITPNNGDIIIRWDAGALKIFKL